MISVVKAGIGTAAIIYNENCLRHDTGRGHPESAERLKAVLAALRGSPRAKDFDWVEATAAPASDVERVHTRSYIRWVEETCLKGGELLDSGDTRVSFESYDAALCSAGVAVSAVDYVLLGLGKRAFALTRPPGHHARPGEAMGFCIFNNIAIAAAHAREKYGLERILIIDWDVHHGNGTQEIFYDDPGVLFFSIHQSPFWPHTGASTETGRGRGEGMTLNVPVPVGADIGTYRKAFIEQLQPAVTAFKPELILISAGFDAHKEDPLAAVVLEDEDFDELGQMVVEWADRYTDGQMISFLEGGYNLRALGRCAERHARLLLV